MPRPRTRNSRRSREQPCGLCASGVKETKSPASRCPRHTTRFSTKLVNSVVTAQQSCVLSRCHRHQGTANRRGPSRRPVVTTRRNVVDRSFAVPMSACGAMLAYKTGRRSLWRWATRRRPRTRTCGTGPTATNTESNSGWGTASWNDAAHSPLDCVCVAHLARKRKVQGCSFFRCAKTEMRQARAAVGRHDAHQRCPEAQVGGRRKGQAAIVAMQGSS